MHKLCLVLLALTLSSCATMSSGMTQAFIRASWLDQPEGARSAFLRCMHDVALEQCGSTDIKDPIVEQCIASLSMEYRAYESKTMWLQLMGCDEKRATLRSGEL